MTTTLDKLYLEWSVYTTARTEREKIMARALGDICQNFGNSAQWLRDRAHRGLAECDIGRAYPDPAYGGPIREENDALAEAHGVANTDNWRPL